MPAKSTVYESMSMRNRERLARLGERLKLARQRRNWTQRQLAEKVGIAVGSLKKLESGTPNVPVAFLLGVLDVFALVEEIDDIALPDNDTVGRSMETPAQRQRVRGKTAPDNDFDLE